MAQDREPTPHMAPAHVPRWLRWLFPGVEEVRDNPLYIRLSGRGFRGGRNRFIAPRLQEYRRGGRMQRSGRALTSLPMVFFRNGAAESWGAELYLTRLGPREIDRALLAANMDRESFNLLAIVAISMVVVAIGTRYGTAMGSGGFGSAEFKLFVLAVILLAPILYIEMVLTFALGFLSAIKRVGDSARVGELGTAVRGTGVGLYVLFSHGLGLLCVLVWLIAMIFVEVLDLASLAPWMLWAGAIAALIVPSFPAEIAIVRQLYAENDGQLGRALNQAIRSDRRP